MMFRCIVNADLFRRAYECVSTEEMRYYLNGVLVETHPDGGAILVATDGRILVAIRDKEALVEGGCGIVHVNREVLAACRKNGGLRRVFDSRSEVPLHLFVEGPRAAVAKRVSDELDGDRRWDIVRAPDQSCEAYQWHGALIDGTFPDWRKVVPKEPADAVYPSSFNPALVARLDAALCRPKSGSSVSLTPTKGEIAPMIAHGDGSVDGFGVLMPLRNKKGIDLAIPSWVPVPMLQAAE
jgi:hypothetical protein